MVKFRFFSGPCSLQDKAECLGWSDSLLLQTEAALIGYYSREQIDYRYVLYMAPLQKTRVIPLIHPNLLPAKAFLRFILRHLTASSAPAIITAATRGCHFTINVNIGHKKRLAQTTNRDVYLVRMAWNRNRKARGVTTRDPGRLCLWWVISGLHLALVVPVKTVKRKWKKVWGVKRTLLL